MKNFNRIMIAFAAIFVALTSSCSKEQFSHSSSGNAPAIAADVNDCPFFFTWGEPGLHADVCACSQTPFDLKDGNGATMDNSALDYGSVFVYSTATDVVVVPAAGFGNLISKVSTYYGPSAGVPMAGGNLLPASFPYIHTLNPLQASDATFIPLASLPDANCNTLVVVVEIARLNPIGQVVPVATVYLAGNPFANGYAAAYCPVQCPGVEISGCSLILNGAPGRDCTTLTANPSGGTGPYTYLWSTGATTPSISVCPSANTTYSVTTTDALGVNALDAYSVAYLDIRCGNNLSKVTICRTLPNGNMIEQCLPLNSAANFVNNGTATWGPCGLADPCN